jgi:2-polyprenyl-3-methyl-5-hydroxy-6-metoxy-1,4-benzoquinol methylase
MRPLSSNTMLLVRRGAAFGVQGMSQAKTRMLASGAKNIADIQAEYAVQAETFEAGWNKRSIGKSGDIMKRVMSHIETLVGEQGQLRALDVACGTGICTRALAASALTAEVTGLDATEQMLSKAREAEAEASQGQTSITYVQGDGAAMPFPDASFDLVTCRLAIHHFANPSEQVKEMARVCAPGGTVVLVDIVSPTDSATAARHNELEAMRDPSHTECKDTAGLVALLHGAGLNPHTHTVAGGEADGEYDNETVPNVIRFDNGMFVDQWLESTRTPAEAREAIRDQVTAEPHGIIASTI